MPWPLSQPRYCEPAEALKVGGRWLTCCGRSCLDQGRHLLIPILLRSTIETHFQTRLLEHSVPGLKAMLVFRKISHFRKVHSVHLIEPPVFPTRGLTNGSAAFYATKTVRAFLTKP